MLQGNPRRVSNDPRNIQEILSHTLQAAYSTVREDFKPFLVLAKLLSQVTLSAVKTIMVNGHTNSRSAVVAVLPKIFDVTATNIVILKNCHGHFLMFMFDFLRCVVVLFLLLLTTTAKPKHQMEGRLFLDVVVRQSSAIFKLFPCKDQPLLLWRNTFLVLNFRFYVGNCVVWLDIKSNGFTREGLDEYLHSHGETVCVLYWSNPPIRE